MKLYRSIIFIFSVLALLAVISFFFPQPSLKVCGVELHFPSPGKIFNPSEADTARAATADDMILAAENELALNVDSASIARSDSMAFYQRFFSESPVRICCPDNDPTYLFPLFDALDSARLRPIHIMHYGDSQIEGDRITGYLRSELQKRFGGSGPGLIPLRQPIPAMSVQQSVSDSVAMYYAGGMIGPRAGHKRYGAMAQMAQLSRSDTLLCSIKSRSGRNLQSVTVYAGNIDSLLAFSVNGVYYDFKPSVGTCKATLDLPKPVSSLSMSFTGRGDVYGINIEGEKGVAVTNIPLRGSDGTFFSRIDPDAMKYMLNDIDTRLIILEFGGNALPSIKDSAAVNRWCNYFKAQIGYVCRMVPKAKVMVIGPADMSVKVDGEFKTHHLLPYLVEQMKKSVTESGAAFWDMFSVMGGNESMMAWVNHRPAWAAPDYIHFTKRGSERISQVLVESLMVYYSYRSFLSSADEADGESADVSSSECSASGTDDSSM
ncbi:MAG: hypothetical protein MJZ15_08860 [Bacteroidales bacterium]|nr:hypothetical protein [Bacteroidales bacterium]